MVVLKSDGGCGEGKIGMSQDGVVGMNLSLVDSDIVPCRKGRTYQW